uniref:Uncharacterized protein n=1 Tax=Anguilla anguilla TaxID=7936 RepID=A0A0E9SPN9_ANGAN
MYSARQQSPNKMHFSSFFFTM